MDELEAACEKLDAAGITAFSLAAKETWVLQQLSTHYMMDKTLDAKGVVEKAQQRRSEIQRPEKLSRMCSAFWIWL